MNDENNIFNDYDDEKLKEEVVNNYQSQYGPFNQYQEGLLLYAQSMKGKLFIFLNILTLLLNWIGIVILLTIDLTVFQDGVIANVNWVKIIFVVILILISIIPIGLMAIYLGSLKFNVKKVLKGLNLIQNFLKILLVLIIFSAVIVGMGLVIIMFRSFGLALVLAVVFGLYFWFFIKYFNVIIDFIGENKRTLLSSSPKQRPHPKVLKTYLIIAIVITVISRIVNGFSLGADLPFLLESTKQVFSIASIILLISSLIQIGTMFYSLYLIDDFNRYLYKLDAKVKDNSTL